MTLGINELKKKIKQKNLILNSVSSSAVSNKDMVKLIETELDSLLYQYYKLLRFK